MKISDFRSDTVTRPDPEMYEAIQRAPLGDDVLGDDPTVAKLENYGAELLGKEAALFLPSGTMANQIACYCHTRAGDEIILEEQSHIYNFESGALTVISRVQPRPLKGVYGKIPLELIQEAIRPPSLHCPTTTLLCLENTHNLAGGTVLELDYCQQAYELALQNGLRLHLDGARIFNAAIASQTEAKKFAQCCHSLSFCLSKGLGAPAGSLLLGDKKFIENARKIRKMLGGAMRQAGILAAAGIVALEKRHRLNLDHQRAKKLALALSKIKPLEIDLNSVQTNIVLVNLPKMWNSQDISQKLQDKGILVSAISPHKIRFVVHKDIDDRDVDNAIYACEKLMAEK